jgi:hypothetical protein
MYQKLLSYPKNIARSPPDDLAITARWLFQLTDPISYCLAAISFEVVLKTLWHPLDDQNFQLVPSDCHGIRTDIGRYYIFFF